MVVFLPEPVWSMPLGTPEAWEKFMRLSDEIAARGGGERCAEQVARELAPEFLAA